MKYLLSASTPFRSSLWSLPDKKLMINTINAHSYNMAQKDREFASALRNSDVLLPDGVSIVYALRFLKGLRLKKIAGADLFEYEMRRLNEKKGSCFFLGCDQQTLKRIHEKVKAGYPEVTVYSFPPSFTDKFTERENEEMLTRINQYRPDVLFIGMTAPKQEKWAFQHYDELETGHICCIGAVFNFYAGTVSRAPGFMIALGLEWLYRFLKEPRRLWRRYLIGNTKFIFLIFREKRKAMRPGKKTLRNIPELRKTVISRTMPKVTKEVPKVEELQVSEGRDIS